MDSSESAWVINSYCMAVWLFLVLSGILRQHLSLNISLLVEITLQYSHFALFYPLLMKQVSETSCHVKGTIVHFCLYATLWRHQLNRGFSSNFYLHSSFGLCISSRLSLFLKLTQASNSIIPLEVDKCGCCDKELEEETMKSVFISCLCHQHFSSTSGCERQLYWCGRPPGCYRWSTGCSSSSDVDVISPVLLFLITKNERLCDRSQFVMNEAISGV